MEDLWVINDALFMFIEIVNYNMHLAHFSAMKISALRQRGSHVQILHLGNNRLGTYSRVPNRRRPNKSIGGKFL